MLHFRIPAVALMCGFTLLLSGCGVGVEELSPPSSSSQPSVANTAEAVDGAADEAFGDVAPRDSTATPPPRSVRPTSDVDAGEGKSSAPADLADSAGLEDAERSADEAIRPEGKEARRRQMQAGLLTAGSFDDHQRFGHFQDFLSRSQQSDPQETLPRMAIGQRAVIHVHNGQGEPIGNARVVVSQKQSQQVLLDARTGSDGRTLFLTGIDAVGVSTRDYDVTVTPPQGQSFTRTMTLDSDEWRIESPKASSSRPQQLDLALVIDATGSMGDELNYLKIEIDHIAATVKRMFPNVDQRYSLILYRDAGDDYVTRVFDFTSSLSTFRGALAKQNASGGGDYPEAMHLAMENAGRLDWRGGNTSRVMFLIGDAPPHDRDAGRTLDAAKSLRKKNVRIFPIAASGAAWKAEYVLRSSAFLTMGQYLFLTDHSGVGNAHATPHVPDYQVEHLNRLMVRMVAQELAGKKLAPQEVIAIERGDSSPLQFQPLEPLAQQVGVHQSNHKYEVLVCGVQDLPRRGFYNISLADLPVDRLTLKWVVYGAAICGIIFLGCVASRA